MLTAAIRIYRLAETDIGRIIAADDAACPFFVNCGLDAFGITFLVVGGIPSIILANGLCFFVATRHP